MASQAPQVRRRCAPCAGLRSTAAQVGGLARRALCNSCCATHDFVASSSSQTLIFKMQLYTVMGIRPQLAAGQERGHPPVPRR